MLKINRKFILAALLIVFTSFYLSSLQLADSFRDYNMEVHMGEDKIGDVTVTMTPRGDDTRVHTRLVMGFPILLLDFKLERNSWFTVKKEGGVSDFHCWLRTNAAGYSYDIKAEKEGDSVTVTQKKRFGTTTKTYKQGEDFDFMTGNITREYIDESGKQNTIRFLDLDTASLQTMKIDINDIYYQDINGEREKMYDVVIKSKALKRRVIIIADNDIPVQMEMNLPVLGWVVTSIVGMDFGEKSPITVTMSK
jgi:hypothetical protein